MQSMFSDRNKLRKIEGNLEKIQNMCKLTNTHLQNQWVKEIAGKIRKYFEINKK